MSAKEFDEHRMPSEAFRVERPSVFIRGREMGNCGPTRMASSPTFWPPITIVNRKNVDAKTPNPAGMPPSQPGSPTSAAKPSPAATIQAAT